MAVQASEGMTRVELGEVGGRHEGQAGFTVWFEFFPENTGKSYHWSVFSGE